MFELGIEKTIIGTAIALWFAHGWYLNERLKSVHEKLDAIQGTFNGLREYLYEVDPQFDDERLSRENFEKHMNGENEDMFAGYNDCELERTKKLEGKRTLDTPFD